MKISKSYIRFLFPTLALPPKGRMHECGNKGKEVGMSPLTIIQSSPLGNVYFLPLQLDSAEINVLLSNSMRVG